MNEWRNVRTERKKMGEIKTEGKVKDKTKNSPCQRNTTGKSQLTGLYVYGTVYGYSRYAATGYLFH